jgi:2-polyprenyl-3-methyl-5-hydroxy-6-metoxy-1,4-benzoquinol methylase
MSVAPTSTVADARTLEAYGTEAKTYAQRDRAGRARDFLEPFLAALAAGGTVLDLGCGAGWAAVLMQERGFDVHALDACSEFVAIASQRLKRPVRLQSFEQLDDRGVFDGIWASGSLLHVPKDALPTVLAKISAALKPGGLLFASFKEGEGEARDSLGRFYAYYSVTELKGLVAGAGLSWVEYRESSGIDFTGQAITTLGIYARSAA